MISVVIPNYNNSNYIEKCIQSVLNQSYKNFEIIIIDDGSTDNSIKIIKNIIARNNKCKIKLYTQNNLNASIARNKGIENASGEYLFFLDSDDYLFSNDVFSKMIEDITNFDLLIGNYQIIDENEKFIEQYVIKDDNNLLNIDNVYKFSMISPVPSNKLYLKSIVDKYNICFSNVRISQDLNFYLKYLSMCKNISIVDYNIYNYRIVSNGISRTVNYNVFDVVKSFEEIDKFYINNNNKEYFDKYIALTQLRHYNFQINRYLSIDSKDFRKSLLLFYRYYYEQIDKSKIYDLGKLKKINASLKKKMMLYPIITTDVFCYFLNKLFKRK